MNKRRYYKKLTVNGVVTLHQHYLYRGYLQIAALDLTRSNAPALWLLHWDPAQPIATRPLSIRKNGTWYTYGHDLTKNVMELYKADGTIATAYDYTPYGTVTASGIDQPIQWSSEHYDPELALVYYNYRHYNPADGRWINRDPIAEEGGRNLYAFVENAIYAFLDVLGLQSAAKKKKDQPQIEPKKKCTFQIVAGHTGKVLEEKMNFAQRKNTKLVTRCDRFYGIACFLNPDMRYVWTTQEDREKAVRNNFSRTYNIAGLISITRRAKADDPTMSEELIRNITLAEKDAVEECNNPNTCCRAIWIGVRCLHDPSMRKAQSGDRIVTLGCQYRNTYTCAQNNKPARWASRLFADRIK